MLAGKFLQLADEMAQDPKHYARAFAKYLQTKNQVLTELYDVFLNLYKMGGLYNDDGSINEEIFPEEMWYVPIQVELLRVQGIPFDGDPIFLNGLTLAKAINDKLGEDNPIEADIDQQSLNEPISVRDLCNHVGVEYRQIEEDETKTATIRIPNDIIMLDNSEMFIKGATVEVGSSDLDRLLKVVDTNVPTITISIPSVLDGLMSDVVKNTSVVTIMDSLGLGDKLDLSGLLTKLDMSLGHIDNYRSKINQDVLAIASQTDIDVNDRIQQVTSLINDSINSHEEDGDDEAYFDDEIGLTFNMNAYSGTDASSMWKASLTQAPLKNACLIAGEVLKTSGKVILGVGKQLFKGVKRLWKKYVEPAYKSKDFVKSEHKDVDNHVDVPFIVLGSTEAGIQYDPNQMAKVILDRLGERVQVSGSLKIGNAYFQQYSYASPPTITTAPMGDYSGALTIRATKIGDNWKDFNLYPINTSYYYDPNSPTKLSTVEEIEQRYGFNARPAYTEVSDEIAIFGNASLQMCRYNGAQARIDCGDNFFSITGIPWSCFEIPSTSIDTNSKLSVDIKVVNGVLTLSTTNRDGSKTNYQLANPVTSQGTTSQNLLYQVMEFSDSTGIYTGYKVNYVTAASLCGYNISDSSMTNVGYVPVKYIRIRCYDRVKYTYFDVVLNLYIGDDGSSTAYFSEWGTYIVTDGGDYECTIVKTVDNSDGLGSYERIHIGNGSTINTVRVKAYYCSNVNYIKSTNEIDGFTTHCDLKFIKVKDSGGRLISFYNEETNTTLDMSSGGNLVIPTRSSIYEVVAYYRPAHGDNNILTLSTQVVASSYPGYATTLTQWKQLSSTENQYHIDGSLMFEWNIQSSPLTYNWTWTSSPMSVLSPNTMENILKGANNPVDEGLALVMKSSFCNIQLINNSNALRMCAYPVPVKFESFLSNDLCWREDLFINSNENDVIEKWTSVFSSINVARDDYDAEEGDVIAYKDLAASKRLTDLYIWCKVNPLQDISSYYRTFKNSGYALNMQSIDHSISGDVNNLQLVTLIHDGKFSSHDGWINFINVICCDAVLMKYDFMRAYYLLTGSFPDFHPYMIGDRLKQPMWHVSTTDEIQDYVENMCSVLISIAMVALAITCGMVVKSKAKRFFKRKQKQLDTKTFNLNKESSENLVAQQAAKEKFDMAKQLKAGGLKTKEDKEAYKSLLAEAKTAYKDVKKVGDSIIKRRIKTDKAFARWGSVAKLFGVSMSATDTILTGISLDQINKLDNQENNDVQRMQTTVDDDDIIMYDIRDEQINQSAAIESLRVIVSALGISEVLEILRSMDSRIGDDSFDVSGFED